MLVFEERGKPEYPEKNLSEQGRELTTNSTHIWRQRRDLNPGHTGERQALSPLRHPCSPYNELNRAIGTFNFKCSHCSLNLLLRAPVTCDWSVSFGGTYNRIHFGRVLDMNKAISLKTGYLSMCCITWIY